MTIWSVRARKFFIQLDLWAKTKRGKLRKAPDRKAIAAWLAGCVADYDTAAIAAPVRQILLEHSVPTEIADDPFLQRLAATLLGPRNQVQQIMNGNGKSLLSYAKRETFESGTGETVKMTRKRYFVSNDVNAVRVFYADPAKEAIYKKTEELRERMLIITPRHPDLAKETIAAVPKQVELIMLGSGPDASA